MTDLKPQGIVLGDPFSAADKEAVDKLFALGLESEDFGRLVDAVLPLGSSQTGPFRFRDRIFSENGLIVENMCEERAEHVYSDYIGAAYAEDRVLYETHFHPDGKSERAPWDLTKIIAGALDALDDFIFLVDNNIIPEPEFIMGETNPRMARFAQRAGFEIVHKHVSGTIVQNTYDSLKTAVTAFDPELRTKLADRLDQRAVTV